MPTIRDKTLDRVGQVLAVQPGVGIDVQWTHGQSVFVPVAKVNSGRYELVA